MQKTPRTLFDRLERRLVRLGPARATAALCGVTVAGALGIHLVLKTLEASPFSPIACFNIVMEAVIVAAPLILYSRRVIRQLAASRAAVEEMSRRMSLTVEETREASRAKSAFLANMSHELRTPLNAILGFSEIMKDQHLGPVFNPRYLSYAADIHASGRHLLGIINDVLDLAKIESGRMSLDQAEEFALVPALSASLTMLTGLGEQHGVAVCAEWPDQGTRIVAVKRMVRQIVINLVGNAIKFTPQGGNVILTGSLAEDGSYGLCVRDSGVGMTPGEIANALTPFGQNRTKRITVTQEGTGLGLPLAKAMIELHGGKLSIESRPEHGTSVTLHFPPERVAKARGRAAA